MGKRKSEEEKLAILKEFVLRADCLNRLTELVSEPNVFDVLKVTKYEIRHSNILAWLFDPNENHGLGDSFLKEIVRIAILNQKGDAEGDEESKYVCDDKICNDIVKDREYWLLDDFRNVRVEREVQPHDKNGEKLKDVLLDLVITADGESQKGKKQRRFLIIIENKVNAKEHKRQTKTYFEESQKATFYSKRKRDNKRTYLRRPYCSL